ncbi:hypothetical protein DV738_g5097, partial [Chaetothyriales sp. CBS 135597]
MTKPVHPDFASDEYIRRWLADPALASAPAPRKQCHESQTDRNGLEAYTGHRPPLPDTRQYGHGASHEPDPSLEYARRPRRRTRPEKYEYRGDEQEKRARKKPATMCRSWKNKSGHDLNRDFKAPNVESKRLTLGYRTTPGFLAKGRASAPMPRRGSPGLAFSEMAFLSKGQELAGAEGRFKAVASAASNHQDSVRSDDSVHRRPIAPTRSSLPPFHLYKPASRSSSCLCRPASAGKFDKDTQACEKHARVEDLGPAAHRLCKYYYSLEDLKELAAAGSRSETVKHDIQLPVDLTVPFMTRFRDGANHDSSWADLLAYEVNDCAAAPVSDLPRVQATDYDHCFQDGCREAADEQGSDIHGQYKLTDSGQALSDFSIPWLDQQNKQPVLAGFEARSEALDQRPMDVPDLDARLSDDDVQPYHLEYMALCQDQDSANHQMLKTSSPGFDAFDSALLASLSRQLPKSVTSSSFHPALSQLVVDPASSSSAAIKQVQEHVAGYASINYRLAPHEGYPQNKTAHEGSSVPAFEQRDAQWPQMLDDVLSALLHLQARYEIGENYLLVGHSVVAGLCGIYDFEALHDKFPSYAYLTRNAIPHETDWVKASPARYSREGYDELWARGRRRWLLLAQSRTDGLVDFEQAEDMHKVLVVVEHDDDGLIQSDLIEIHGKHDEIWKQGDELARVVAMGVGKMISLNQ